MNKKDLQDRLKKYAIAIVKPLWKEGDELLAIIVSSIITTKKNKNK
jgi:hypothetical protein